MSELKGSGANTDNGQRILIAPAKVREARPLSPAMQFQRGVVQQVFRLVEEALDKAKQSDEDAEAREPEIWDDARVHQNVGLLGTRGAGKTQVLVTLLKLLSSESNLPPLTREDRGRKSGELDALAGYAGSAEGANRWLATARRLAVAGLVEPSSLEKGDHIVETIFSLMFENGHARLEKVLLRNPEDERQANEFSSAAEGVRRQLPLLVAEGRLGQAFDKGGDIALDDEVGQRRSGRQLERALRRFTRAYLKLLGREMVVIALDDVDLAYERGEEVLESVRRYLTSPRMLLLVTGDLQLFESVLRLSTIRKASGDRKGEASWYTEAPLSPDQISVQVEQYLKKVLPAALRLRLKSVDEVGIQNVDIRQGQAPDVAFKDHFPRILRICLAPRATVGSAEHPPGPELLERFRFLVPNEARRFVELCGIDTEADASEVWERFIQVWQGELQSFRLDAERLRALAGDLRIGRIVLKLLMEHPFDGLAIHLDVRTGVARQNIGLAFLQHAMEFALVGQAVEGALTLALDYFVPSTYLAREQEGRRPALAEKIGLAMHDGSQDLTRRLVTWLARTHQVKPAVVPLCGRPGQLDRLLDVHDPSRSAQWRRVLTPPRRARIERPNAARRRRALEYLEKGGTAERSWSSVSAWRWATEYLPQISDGRDWRMSFPSSPRFTPGEPRPRPWVSECVVPSQLFHRLAGALPRVVARCWTVRDGEDQYLSPWQALSALQRILQELAGLWSGTSPMPEIVEVHALVLRCLREHLDTREGPARELRMDDDSPPEPVVVQRPVREHPDRESATDGRLWGDFVWEAEQAREWLSFYPRLNDSSRPFCWRPPARAGDPETPRVPSGQAWRARGTWFSEAPSDTRCFKIEDRNGLRRAQLMAWDSAVDRLAMAITEWAVVWIPRLKDYSSRRSLVERNRLEQIRAVISTFFADLGDEEDFAGRWPGAGDIIQRWVLSFLNAVLVETLEPASSTEPGTGGLNRPTLERIHTDPRPGRTEANQVGCNHALYANLLRLQEEAGGWRCSEVFLGMASFPLFAMFLPASGPFPEVKDDGFEPQEMLTCLEKYMEETSGDGEARSLRSVVCMGSLMLLPLHSQQRLRDPVIKSWKSSRIRSLPFPLDLAGLSWCGFDLVELGAEREARPIQKLEARRAALIEMLNCLVADIRPCEEAEGVQTELILAVYGALVDARGDRHAEKA